MSSSLFHLLLHPASVALKYYCRKWSTRVLNAIVAAAPLRQDQLDFVLIKRLWISWLPRLLWTL